MSRRTAAWLAWSLYGIVTCLSMIWSGVILLSQDGSRNALYLAGEALNIACSAGGLRDSGCADRVAPTAKHHRLGADGAGGSVCGGRADR
jgi:hypothetical protein